MRWLYPAFVANFDKTSSLGKDVELSLIDHKETITLGTPALIKERDKPITPSPVTRPLPVLQALRTTSSAWSFRSRISPDVKKPLHHWEQKRCLRRA